MSLQLPPPVEGPDEDLASLREMVEMIRGYIADAERQVALLETAVREHAESADRVALVHLTHYTVELGLAQQRVATWRRLGLSPERTARERGLSL